MIDIHSHVLPQMDDGSQSVEESLAMLEESAVQGVEIMVATPHFYARREHPESFLKRRERSWDQLLAAYGPGDGLPQLLVGAEVAYFDGMNHCDELRQFCIGKSQLLMVEMPFGEWSSRMVDEICDLKNLDGIIPVLAHVNRYLHKSQLLRYRETLLQNGVLFQCNAEAFLTFGQLGRVMKMYREHQIHFLGSDAHNTDSRPQRLGAVIKKLEKNLGTEQWEAWKESMEGLLLNKE